MDSGIQTFYRHGGRLADARTTFPDAPEPWIDLSTGVNPVPWPLEADDHETALPDPAALLGLEHAAAEMFGADPARVAAVPGSDLALRLLPHVIPGERAGIAEPTYGGHGESWTAAGAAVTYIHHNDLTPGAIDVAVRVNPNNPTGAALDRAALLALADHMANQNGWLIVDEAFADARPQDSVADVAHDRLIVLRSFGKFFGQPGLRLGFVIGPSEILVPLRNILGEWPVSRRAAVTGRKAYGDRAWQDTARARLEDDVAALDRDLTEAGFSIVGGTRLFRLARRVDADACFMRLAEAGVLTRPFIYEPSWLRFGIPKSADRERVRKALRACP